MVEQSVEAEKEDDADDAAEDVVEAQHTADSSQSRSSQVKAKVERVESIMTTDARNQINSQPVKMMSKRVNPKYSRHRALYASSRPLHTVPGSKA